MTTLFRTTATALATVLTLSLAAPAQAQLIADETVQTLSQQVAALRETLSTTTEMVTSNQERVNELEYVAQNASAVTDEMMADMQALIDAFNTESDYFATIQAAKIDIKTKIDEFREGTDAQKRAAEILRERLAEFETIDDRRDDLVGRAMAVHRNLAVQKLDLEALLIVEAYTEMSKLFTQMLDEVEVAVEEAEQVNDSLTDAAGLDRQ